MPRTKIKRRVSPTFYVEVTNHIVKRYAVKAPTARQALIPIEHLVAHWPCEVLEAKTSITNVVQKRRRFYAGKLINRNKGK